MKQDVIHSSIGPLRSSQGQARNRSHERRLPQPIAKGRYSVEVSAGGIIFRRRKGMAEFFFVKHGKSGKWTLPKGHQEKGESLIETAVREIREEAGLHDLRYVCPIGKTSFRFTQAGRAIEKHVEFFLFEAPADAQEQLTGEEAIWEAIWVPVEHVFETCGYRNLDRLLAKALRVIASSHESATS